jgi:ubiquinone/menaquinone biosynthesis C-methylase UbiE
MARPGEAATRAAAYGRRMTREALSEYAALAAIDRRRRGMTTQQRSEAKAAARAAWRLGDYHRFATELIWDIGPVVVAACGIRPGQRVLDVAAGTGNVAIRAAEAGASVVASDLTPEHFQAGRAEAGSRGVELDWVEADAEALPFADGAFDVVTSSFGAMFAPDHRAVADELVRVCRPGGAIGLASFTPDGLAAGFFGLFAPYLPAPPPGAQPPVLWGSEEHVRDLFGDRVEWRLLAREQYVERAASPQAYCAFFKETFGPVIAVYASLADEPERAAGLDAAFLDFATRANEGPPEGPAAYRWTYLLAVAETRV